MTRYPDNVAATSHPLVVKIGSSTLTTSESSIDYDYLDALAAQIAAVRAAGWQPVIVTSAAIACGLEALGIRKRPDDMPSLQAAASVGQSALSAAYAQAFSAYDMITSVVLLTRRDTADRTAYLHARDTLRRLLEMGVVPIVNENDTVSVEQIRFGDNDTLGALVSCLVGADLCVILSDIDGLYTANPGEDPDARLLPEVRRIDRGIVEAAGDATSGVGTGGMITKIRAARVLMCAGIPTVVCGGREPNQLVRLAAGEEIGTRFIPPAERREIAPRKLWIALGDTVHGTLTVDGGAADALRNRGSSLLAVGITRVEGAFERGDVVNVADEDGFVIARGRAGASADELFLAAGRSQAEIEGNRLLADLAGHPAVHRDEMIVFV